MTRNHIYLHTSNLDCLRYLDDDDLFEHVCEYYSLEILKTHRNEYGRIKTDINYFHILIGKIRDDKCAWCNFELTIKCLYKDQDLHMQPKNYSKYCLECKNCGSRGPICNIVPEIEEDKIAFEHFVEIMKYRYSDRKYFDFELLNGKE